MFDSSKCLKAEAFLVSTATTLAKKKKKKKFSVFRSISDLPRRSSSLPRSYPHVFPSKYPTSEINIAHLSTQSAFPPRPLAGWGLTRASAVPCRSTAARRPRPGLGGCGGQVLRAALPLRSTGGPSVAAALSVCVNQRGGCSPLPAADFPFV